MKKSKSPAKQSSERDQLILEHVARYRLTTLEAIQRVVLCGVSRNAVNKIVNRLCDNGFLQKHTLLYPTNYFVLGEAAVRRLGLGSQRATPLGPQSLPQEYAVLAFATLGAQHHLRMNALEVKHHCPFLTLALAAAPHCLDEAGVLELVRVDLGGPPDHVARKCVHDISERSRIPEFLTLIITGRFRLVIVTTTSGKVSAIERSLSQHLWPQGLLIHFSVVPQLFAIGGNTQHA